MTNWCRRDKALVSVGGAAPQLRSVLLCPEEEGARGYWFQKVLVSDKAEVTIILACPVQNGEDGVLAARAGEQVVIKVVRLSSKEHARQAACECRALERLGPETDVADTHVAPLLGLLRDKSHLYIVLPYFEAGDLFSRVVESNAGLPTHEARRYFIHVVRGLLHLKERGIAHGDVSPENVLLSFAWCGKDERPCPPSNSAANCVALPSAHLIDLGSSHIIEPGAPPVVPNFHYRGKIGYVPPEALDADYHSAVDPFAVDVWSLGVCLYICLTGRPLYSSPDDPSFALLAKGRARTLLRHYETFGLALSPCALDLICSMLSPDPAARPTLEALLAHPWTKGRDEEEALVY